jgi:hypothetical protein
MAARLMDGFRLTTGPEIFLFAIASGLISLVSNGHRTVLQREKLLEISHNAQFLNAWNSAYAEAQTVLYNFHFVSTSSTKFYNQWCTRYY